MSEEKTAKELITEAREYYDRGINKWGRDRLDQVLTQLAAEQKDYKQAKSKLREIINLCSNCRSLGDAQCIAGGQENTSTESGCEKCWVEKLQAKLDAEQKEKEGLEDQFECLSKLVIMEAPELWEDYLVDVKQALKKGGG